MIASTTPCNRTRTSSGRSWLSWVLPADEHQVPAVAEQEQRETGMAEECAVGSSIASAAAATSTRRPNRW
jgi:hypothetical protein